MTAKSIGSLLAKDISRRIEEVIKVDQTDEDVIGDEIAEYVITDSIRSHYDQILDRYWETPKKLHEGIAVWVSGFFGSGKSSFAKFLGLALENRSIKGRGAAKLFGERAGSSNTQVLLNSIR
jgi:2-phosphoglycerate kinase